MKVVVGLAHYGSWFLTQTCLAMLRRHPPVIGGAVAEVRVVDNSWDWSPSILGVTATEFGPFQSDPRMRCVCGNSLEVADQIGAGFDFLFIDSDHRADHAEAEWRLYSPLLNDGAMVCVDDINMNDMRRFWDALLYEKVALPLNVFGFGVMRYRK